MEQTSCGTGNSAVSTLCHDLRQYVAAGLLLSEVSDHEPAAARDARLATIHTLFEQIRLVINAATDETAPPCTKLELPEIIHDCVRIARVTTEARITACVMPTATAFGDGVLLRRAVANVLDNAARAPGKNGAVDVWDSGDESVIEVTDDGLRFGQAPRGSGRGMSVVATARRACHGRLEIASGPTPGTTVRMVLPRWRAAS
jgi:signal transduction histidine kinase